MALRTIATAATILCAMLPAVAQSQSGPKTACNDGTTTTATGPDACNGHHGIDRAHTAIVRRAPSGTTVQTQEPARVTQAGSPTSRAHAQPEERRGWRWAHHDDRDDNRRAEERRRAEEKARVEERREHDEHHVRCRDGKFERVKPRHGNGRGPDVCKHHGGVAH
jgi:hypothetical protein